MRTRQLRRLRRTEAIRRLTGGAKLDPSRMVLPIFVSEGISEPVALSSLPGHFHLPVNSVQAVAKETESLGISGLLIFGLPESKDASGSRASEPDGPAQRAIEQAKSAAPGLAVFSDVCLCSYTDHGHCGLVNDDGEVMNDSTVERLTEVALSHAAAGADFVSPSDMMDGRVAAIRKGLDDSGHPEAGIMSYSAKFASAMYGPFREAAGSTPGFGDRRGYQIDPSSRRDAMASIERDIAEGADIVMVKPALSYLDVIREARDKFTVPISAYNVSGEYAMVKAGAEKGLLDEQAAASEILTSILRAGADFVITYHALEAARWLDRAGK